MLAMVFKGWVAIYGDKVFYPQQISVLSCELRPTWSSETLNVATQENPIFVQAAAFNIGDLPAGALKQDTAAGPVSQTRLENINLLSKVIRSFNITHSGVYIRSITPTPTLESGKYRAASFISYDAFNVSKGGKPFIVVGDYPIQGVMNYAAYMDAFEDKQTVDSLLKRFLQPKTEVCDLADLKKLALMSSLVEHNAG